MMIIVSAWIIWAYRAAVLLLALFGVNWLILWLGAVWVAARGRSRAPAAEPTAWPRVLVQLPVFNERQVAQRSIDAAAALDYPADRLLIQVLDDSTDDTPALARARVAGLRARGVPITYRHRQQRAGFKAGALAAGLAAAPEAELVAIFDADFVPPADFLRRLVPDFAADARLGMVQARWEHLNPDQNWVTRGQALAIDSYFSVEQVARGGLGWLMNFNGSAGVWRRACIDAVGGWQGDTLAEDLDLSFRAQLGGWRLAYRPEVAAPAELPPSILALKRQQFRWAKGSFQVLGKLGPALIFSRQPLTRKLLGLLQLAGYLPQPLVVLSLLLSLPVVLAGGVAWPAPWNLLGWLGLVPPVMACWGQWRLRPDPAWRMRDYPLMVLGMLGLALGGTRAAVEVALGRASDFQRTPKSLAEAYGAPVEWTTWGELGLAVYALATGLLALEYAPGMASALFLYTLGFGAVAGLSFWESAGAHRATVESVQ